MEDCFYISHVPFVCSRHRSHQQFHTQKEANYRQSVFCGDLTLLWQLLYGRDHEVRLYISSSSRNPLPDTNDVFFVLNPICLDFTTANVNLTVSRHHLEACVLSAGGWRLHFCNRMTQSILHDTLPILLRVLGYLIKISTLRSKSSTTRRILYDGDGLPCRTVSLGTVDTSNTNNNITLQSSLLSGYSRQNTMSNTIYYTTRSPFFQYL